jgi:predicted ATP-binding protein involved in virulence
MQLHPDNQQWGKELELLKEKSLIGLGKSTSEIAYINFKDDMNIADVVVIKRGATPLALVEVEGSCEDTQTNDEEKLDWFRYRRKVKVLSTDTEGFLPFPQPRKTLQKAINKYSLTYKYIDNWYQNYQNIKKDDHGLKINSIKISDHKMFSDFEIDFLDDESKPLPLVVIVGKNGTGKTTLLEYISNMTQHKPCDINYTFDGKEYDLFLNTVVNIASTKESNELLNQLNKNIIYLKAGIINSDEIKTLEKLFLDYVDYFIYEKSLTAKDGYEAMKSDLEEIFDEFDLGFEFENIDYKEKRPSFINKKSDVQNKSLKIDDLSTGEKTLLSKVFYLYLQEAKNKVILIDEPELSLHPSWQNKVVGIYEKFAKINNNQIIIATHSPHILANVENKYIRVLTKNEEGKIESIKKGLYAKGRDMNSILFDIMGEVQYRPKKYSDMIDSMYSHIDNNRYKEALELFNKLKENYGENDTVIIEAKMALELMEPEHKI